MELCLHLGLRDAAYADTICKAIDADPEPRPDKITRQVSSADGTLRIVYRSRDIKLIRTASSGLLENVRLAVSVVAELSPEAIK